MTLDVKAQSNAMSNLPKGTDIVVTMKKADWAAPKAFYGQVYSIQGAQNPDICTASIAFVNNNLVPNQPVRLFTLPTTEVAIHSIKRDQANAEPWAQAIPSDPWNVHTLQYLLASEGVNGIMELLKGDVSYVLHGEKNRTHQAAVEEHMAQICELLKMFEEKYPANAGPAYYFHLQRLSIIHIKCEAKNVGKCITEFEKLEKERKGKEQKVFSETVRTSMMAALKIQ